MAQSGPQLAAAVQAWRQRPPVDEGLPHWRSRYVVLDIATSGLHSDDRLRSLAALGVDRCGIRATDALAFDPVGDASDVANWLALLEFSAGAPLVTYQAPFVDAFLRPAAERALGIELRPAWIDLAWILPELCGEAPGSRLDDWLRHFAIAAAGRPQAMPDAFAIARLLLVVLAAAGRRGLDSPRRLREIENQRRWLGR